MKRIIAIALMATAVASVHAQAPAGGRPAFTMSEGQISGQIVDGEGKPISQASVNLLKVVKDQTTGKEREILVKSTSSSENGKFNFPGISPKEKWKLKISSVGYTSIDLAVDYSDSKTAAKDLGAIKLDNDTRKLDEVTVTGRKALLEMDIDKKVFNVEKNIVAAGGTAIDVLRNMPSVQVDIDGNVKLRNAAPTIFVDGKPTTLTPDQIPADVIDKIEIITNPSAKYDASGSMAGILNIILKKNKKAGYNGMVTLGGDRFGGTNFMGSLNLRQNKFNISLTGMNMRMRTNTEGDSHRTSTINGIESTVDQDIEGKTKGMITFGRLGVDYDLSPKTTLSVAGVLVQGKFKPNENSSILTTSSNIESRSDRISESERSFKPRGLQAGLVQKFKTEGEELSVDFNYFGGNNTSNGLYTTNYRNASREISGTQIQKNIGSGDNKFMTVQADYVKPFKNGMKLETGVRAQINKLKNLNNNSLKAVDKDDFENITAASANYNNKNSVYAAYASIGGNLKDWVSYKVGLRAESSTYDGELLNTNEKFHNKYALSLFPSLFLSKKLTEKDQIQMSVTRRVNRPNFFQLIPFVDYTDSLNITRGNPDLVPEFTTSGELSYSRTHGKGTFLATVYYKRTNNLITRYLTQEVNPVTNKMDFINTYINANSSKNYGAEFTYTNNLKKWWDLTADLNFYNSKIEVDEKTPSEGMWTVFGKLNNTFNLQKNWNLQLAFEYQGKTNMPVTQGQTFGPPMNQAQSSSQGYIKPFYGIDFAIKKSFLKNQAASATLAINDIFRTRGNTIVSSGEGFSQTYYRLSNPQLIKLNLSYRFGKMDMNMFKKNKNQNSMEGIQMQ
ncbi:TonB-dependent receptor [Sphingobacterium paramultivorum]|uniref:TonB-dependent receptor n=1 Tax=Sphingobacterium paramultivorum TaxID=2886510 RepID=A0A7G5DXT0_9SPHI|nr:outer membrane beta-barrel family protein [Sphingobacterium paramultivorum]QMV66555.1 TonB-dependent receptor [Sphingobacterium paramultivorum]WSO15367.1 TonB-dependent receptor [Sphingobacterium paramultivorum]